MRERPPSTPVGVRRLGIALVLVTAAVSVRCQLGFECNPQHVVSRMAGPNATNCGDADGWEDTFWDDVESARECIASAIRTGERFFATVSPASSDGGTVIGYAGSGDGLFRIRYDYAIGMMCGGDMESIDHDHCERLIDEGADCDSLADDLCLHCLDAESFDGPCR